MNSRLYRERDGETLAELDHAQAQRLIHVIQRRHRNRRIAAIVSWCFVLAALGFAALYFITRG